MFKAPKDVKRVASIGGGPIGGGWTAHFLARGYDVTTYLHSEAEIPAFRTILDTAWISLTALGLAEGASLDRLTIETDIEKAVEGADFIQESAPENLEMKQELYRRLGEVVPKDVVIGSSTSGLMMSDIQAKCATPERTVIGHPFNPPYLLPLVEIVGGDNTVPEAVQWAGEFYRIAGKAPLMMKKEIPGFVATRLQEALWREALHMVANGEATPEDIDIALMNGPAPRMMAQGQCMAFHVACGEGGMATNLDQFGPALKLPWTRLEAPELTQELRDRMVEGCNDIAGDQHFSDMATQRDKEIVALLNALRASRDDG
ncbi:carnitine 3-dehydrogenase [Shimia gijangensis]|uniref:Carnitine 3-dehydrogenase n=1 Tax=Shimia gijangensis TaxID=1470563 RepID=A0A1M6C9Y4_9RHOB|nr:3-hydroxyacyl-CoA dehydrogenase NAD-binding domain-containing protein [Shimia gijangensis]SHI57832.1 carnitine 3-dehydrogenase [Shimia gijangensis]